MTAPDAPPAEDVILTLCAVLIGLPSGPAGLLSREIDGRRHTARCPFGQRLTSGLPGGDPCSEQCRLAAEALELAEDWLRAHDPDPERLARFPRRAP